MFIRKCKNCGTDVQVEKKSATIVLCKKCQEEKGYCTEKRDYDTDNFVYCRICQTAKRKLDSHLRSEHNKTVDEFPDAPIYANNTIIKKRSRNQESRQKTAKALKLSWQDEEVRKRREPTYGHNKGCHHTIETKLKIAKSCLNSCRRSVKGFRKDLGFAVRSTFEANMCRIFNLEQVKYGYEESFFDLNDGTILIIDFFLHQDFEMLKTGFLELKGWKKPDGYFSNKEKFDLLEKFYPDIYSNLRILFLQDKDWKFLEKKYRPLIPLWETAIFNLKSHPEIFSRDQQNIKESWDEYIICPLCVKENLGVHSKQKFITYKHIKNHGYTFKQFKEEFPNQKMKVDSLCQEHSLATSGKNHFNFGKHLSEETKQRISEGVLASL